jgi:hypothetical protein
MKLSRLAALAGILVWVAAGCIGNVAPGTGTPGTGGTPGGSCSAGLTMCGATCANTNSNFNHCGGCDKACANGQVCDSGKCSSSCSAGTMLCGSSCATVATDPAHCGNCTTMCRSDQTCTGGACVCPSGTTLCPSGTCATNCGGTGTGGTSGSGGATGSGGSPPLACNTPMPGRAPLRRLSAFEYNNTIRDLLQDATNPGNALPSEAIGNGFGNNADEQSVSASLAEGYGTVGADIAARATKDATALGKLAPCASTVTAAMEESCATTIINTLLPRAFRRTVTAAEQTDYLTLYKTVRALNASVTFASGVAAVLEAVLQAPEFLYRIEMGMTDPANPSIKKLTPRELATRLSYFFWQTMPDATLTTAADGNMLSTPAQVTAQATRLLNDKQSHPTVAFFFDNVLPLPILTDLARDKDTFPTFSPTIGQQMRQETQRTIEYEIFENTTAAPGSAFMPGSWPALLTAPYTFVNQALFNYYGAGAFSGTTSLTGTTLQKVNLNTSQRLGVLLQGAVMAGTTTTNLTNPVLRGSFVINKLMCRGLGLPTDPDTLAKATTPVPYTGWTSRERYSAHAAQPVCKACHQFLDPIGLALENYDAVGLYRTTEHATINGETRDTPIDASGGVPGVAGTANGGVDLVKLLATSEEMNTCFATHWIEFAYGREMEAADACNKQAVQTAFKNSGYNIKQMLLAITQTDGFLSRPAQ